MKKGIFVFLVMLPMVATTVVAQEPIKKGSRSNWDVTLGLGGQYGAVTPGVDEYKFSAVPYFDISYKDTLFVNASKGIGGYVLKYLGQENQLVKNASLGLALGYDGGRDKDDFEDNDNLKGLGDLDGSPEAKLLLEAEIGMFDAGLEFAHGLNSDGHDGWHVDGSVMFNHMVSEKLHVGVGPSVRFSDENYQQAYFGVNVQQSSATGLSIYNPDGGLESAALQFQARYFLRQDWALTGMGEYRHLLSEAADSPFVDQEGQASAMVILSYHF